MKNTDIDEIVEKIRKFPGLTRKRDICVLADILSDVTDFGETAADLGEDAAAVHYRGEYLLLAADGIWSGLIEANPYGAGKAAVMASVNDIYAMGGRPLAMVNVVGIPDSNCYREIMRGIRKGCQKFRVPMVGGHLHPDTREAALSVAVMGTAKQLLRSTNAAAGQDIVFAVDLDGRGYQCKPVLSWDTNSGKSTEQVNDRLEILPMLAESHLCRTAKDVSNAGLLGTIALLLETSGKGALIDLDRVPVPDGFSLIDWLRAFLSYGFVLCVDRQNTDPLLNIFREKAIHADVIGNIDEKPQLVVSRQGEQRVLFNFEAEKVTGISPPKV